MEPMTRRALARTVASAAIPASLAAERSASAVESLLNGGHVDQAAADIVLKPSGGDDTAAILQAFKEAGEGRSVRFGDGVFKFNANGPNFRGDKFIMRGSGAANTTIELSRDSYFICAEQPINRCELSGFRFSGGRGAFNSTWSGTNVSSKKIFNDNEFIGYSECAIQNNGKDEPYWIIDNNVFDGADSTQTIGVALSHGCDSSLITRNVFLRNRIHLKARNAGVSTIVHNNEFLFFDRGKPSAPRISIWLVPHSNWVNAGCGFVATQNKFGNENQAATDYRIVFANEYDDMSANGRSMPQLSISGSGYVDGHIFSDNKISGGKSIPFIYSTVTNVRNQMIVCNRFDGAPPSEIIGFLKSLSPDAFSQLSLLAFNSFGDVGVNSPPPVASRTPGVAVVVDPFGVFESDPSGFHQFPGGGDTAGFELLLNSETSEFLEGPGYSFKNQATSDAMGGADAREVELIANRKMRFRENAPAARPGEASWIEFDLSRSSEAPLDFVDAALISEGEAVNWMRRVRVPVAGWRRFRFPFVFRQAIAALCFDLTQSERPIARAKVGRVRIYHAREPVNFPRVADEGLNCSRLPDSPAGLKSGAVWVDAAQGNVLKRVQ